ncbi:hypothetical protein D918_03852 [Trichuris suis]|nr:hypothetical protein D918_03852 [Trichuris suis]
MKLSLNCGSLAFEQTLVFLAFRKTLFRIMSQRRAGFFVIIAGTPFDKCQETDLHTPPVPLPAVVE